MSNIFSKLFRKRQSVEDATGPIEGHSLIPLDVINRRNEFIKLNTIKAEERIADMVTHRKNLIKSKFGSKRQDLINIKETNKMLCLNTPDQYQIETSKFYTTIRKSEVVYHVEIEGDEIRIERPYKEPLVSYNYMNDMIAFTDKAESLFSIESDTTHKAIMDVYDRYVKDVLEDIKMFKPKSSLI